jgi:polyketide cyclase/dehydrase/lipid transport protein
MAREESNSGSAVMDRLKAEAQSLVGALGDRAVESVRDKVEGAAGRLTEYVEGGGGPGVMAALTGARNLAEGKSPGRSMLGAGFAGVKEKIAGMFGKGGKGGGSRKLKLTNIVESVDVGVPVAVAYNQWTQYSDFPKFTKKVESVDQNKDEENKTNWKAQVFWSHRTWEATVIEQVPDEMIIWRSKGQKGHVDGAVTFHELAPKLTRILLVLEYHPQGMFEHTGNLWRAQGRRARLELKHFQRHLMTDAIMHADDLEGWRGTIHDGEVVESHEDAMEREEQEGPQQDESRQARQSGNGQVDDEAQDQRDEDRDDDTDRDEADEREEASAETDRAPRDDKDRETGDDKNRAGRNGRTARSAERSGTRRSAGTHTRGSAASSHSGNSGNGRRRRTGAASQRGGER